MSTLHKPESLRSEFDLLRQDGRGLAYIGAQRVRKGGQR